MAEFKITQQRKNPLLHREELNLEIHSESNPSYKDILAHLGKDEKTIVIKSLKGNFGRKIFNADIVVYDSEDAKNKIEVTPRKTRKKAAEAAKAAQTAAQTKPAETKPEEKKE